MIYSSCFKKSKVKKNPRPTPVQMITRIRNGEELKLSTGHKIYFDKGQYYIVYPDSSIDVVSELVLYRLFRDMNEGWGLPVA